MRPIRAIKIGNIFIGDNCPPLIVAEMSGNHNQSLRKALRIVDEAARAGAHALKIQTYTADTMTLDVKKRGFLIRDSKSLWNGMSLYQLYKKAYTPWQWHEPIFKRCRKLELIGFSTPFDATAVDFLESLNVPCYKIASFENTDIPLLHKVALTGKPVMISSGMATRKELEEAVATLRETGCREIVLLKCTSAYPASPEDSNVRTIPHMRQLYKCHIGLSDHSLGFGVAIAGIALGACVIEKHFTLSRSEGGVDSVFSMEPAEMKALTIESKKAWQALGRINYGPTKAEKRMMAFRRSIYVVKDLKAGDEFREDNLKIIRPGYGLAPRYYHNLIGKRAKRDLKKGTAANWDLVAGYSR